MRGNKRIIRVLQKVFAAAMVLAATGFASPPFLENPIPDTSLLVGDTLRLNAVDFFTDMEDGDLLGILDYNANPEGSVSLWVKGLNQLVIRGTSPTGRKVQITLRTIDAEQYIAADSFLVEVRASGITPPRKNRVPARPSFSVSAIGNNTYRFQNVGNRNVRISDAYGRIVTILTGKGDRAIVWNAGRLCAGICFAALVDGEAPTAMARKMVVFNE